MDDESELYLLAGLGNPGGEYKSTRHNIGFMVIDRLADRYAFRTDKTKGKCRYGLGEVEGKRIIAAKPLAFMNNSGPPLLQVAQFFKISGGKMLIIHDDIDLAFGKIKIKTKGGHGGHNGIRSIIDTFGTGDFTRVRVGINHPGAREGVVGHVLGGFSADEKEHLGRLIEHAGEAVAAILQHGARAAMNRFHGILHQTDE
ncbi:MAG: aminoacyl-tRNA hydrolase [Thermodesulfobacteriota bacterium]